MHNDCTFMIFLSHNLTAAAVKVTNDIAHMCFGRGDIHFHDRFENDRLALRAASLIAMEPQILKAISLESTSW